MADDFYTQWLGVAPGDRPPDHYALLGVQRFCPDLDAVERAARAQLRRLDEYTLHPDRDTRDAVQDMMNEVARARMCLVHPEKRAAYDEGLARKLGVRAPAAAGPVAAGRSRRPAAPPPVPPQFAVERPRPPAAPAAPVVPDEVVRFEELVWSHLRKWKLNAQEERLLLAEAENLGVDGTIARQIIARVDRQAEESARKKHRRWAYGVVGLSAAAVMAMVLCVAIPAWMERTREGAYERHVGAARQGLGAAEFSAHLTLTLDLGGGVSMKLVAIPAGKFLMGSHEVTLTQPFYMGACEVTQAQYEQIVGSNPSYFKGKRNPVERVSWEEATAFCKKLSAKTGKTVRLPTEAEWEYACRAGTSTPFHTGATISTDEANYDGNYTYGSGRKGVYREKTVPVGSFKPNARGLYDMHGNVWEWCQDWYGPYPNGNVRDPRGPTSGGRRVLRGGSWLSIPAHCRSAYRSRTTPGGRNSSSGFRVVVLLSSGVD